MKPDSEIHIIPHENGYLIESPDHDFTLLDADDLIELTEYLMEHFQEHQANVELYITPKGE